MKEKFWRALWKRNYVSEPLVLWGYGIWWGLGCTVNSISKITAFFFFNGASVLYDSNVLLSPRFHFLFRPLPFCVLEIKRALPTASFFSRRCCNKKWASLKHSLETSSFCDTASWHLRTWYRPDIEWNEEKNWLLMVLLKSFKFY